MRLCPLCGQLYSGHAGVFLDEESNDVIIDEEKIYLAIREFDFFAALVKSAPRVATNEYVMDYVYGRATDNEPDKKIIDVYICKLRKKIKHTRFRILTEFGTGHRLVEKEVTDGENKQAN